ncbi:hypothetical protein EK904_003562 [Melospiza melodia maxima]|nr:hypothetical protein EK904_003562 [Melospiza melodia maxima]
MLSYLLACTYLVFLQGTLAGPQLVLKACLSRALLLLAEFQVQLDEVLLQPQCSAHFFNGSFLFFTRCCHLHNNTSSTWALFVCCWPSLLSGAVAAVVAVLVSVEVVSDSVAAVTGSLAIGAAFGISSIPLGESPGLAVVTIATVTVSFPVAAVKMSLSRVVLSFLGVVVSLISIVVSESIVPAPVVGESFPTVVGAALLGEAGSHLLLYPEWEAQLRSLVPLWPQGLSLQVLWLGQEWSLGFQDLQNKYKFGSAIGIAVQEIGTAEKKYSKSKTKKRKSVTPILVHPYTCLPSTASSGDSSSSVEDLLDLLSGGVSRVGFSVCAEREKIIYTIICVKKSKNTLLILKCFITDRNNIFHRSLRCDNSTQVIVLGRHFKRNGFLEGDRSYKAGMDQGNNMGIKLTSSRLSFRRNRRLCSDFSALKSEWEFSCIQLWELAALEVGCSVDAVTSCQAIFVKVHLLVSLKLHEGGTAPPDLCLCAQLKPHQALQKRTEQKNCHQSPHSFVHGTAPLLKLVFEKQMEKCLTLFTSGQHFPYRSQSASQSHSRPLSKASKQRPSQEAAAGTQSTVRLWASPPATLGPLYSEVIGSSCAKSSSRKSGAYPGLIQG